MTRISVVRSPRPIGYALPQSRHFFLAHQSSPGPSPGKPGQAGMSNRFKTRRPDFTFRYVSRATAGGMTRTLFDQESVAVGHVLNPSGRTTAA